MLPILQAERQLLAIEAAVVPHMKPEDAAQRVRAHSAVLRPKEERPKSVMDAFLRSGLPVVEVPTKKPSRKRRDTVGHDARPSRGNA